jgi:molecular chaperone GrpE
LQHPEESIEGYFKEHRVTEEKKQQQTDSAQSEPDVQPQEPEAVGSDISAAAGDGGSAARPESSSEHRPKKDGKSRKLTKKEILNLLAQKNEKILELSERNKAAEAEIKGLKDRWLRSAAEFENYRKRTRKEWELLQQQAKIEVILEILNVLDDFERAFSVVGDRDDEFVQGIRLIFNNLTAVLEKLAVTRIEALGSAFDPNYHMAVSQMEKEGAESNHVIDVVQHGYLLGETVIRPAKVVIAK